jgi:cysteinyl-tRNA synthetase
MSTTHLGVHFDIHGGGMDLQFPHHENEIAQSEACTAERFVNVWMHNGFVRINEEKMSKSLGNFFTVREVLKRFTPEEVRYFILSSHYRSPLNYSDEQLMNARSALTRLYTALRGLQPAQARDDQGFKTRFNGAMNDDFNTAEALAVLFDLAHEINKVRINDKKKAAAMGTTLKHLGEVLGLLQDDPDAVLKRQVKGTAPLSTDNALKHEITTDLTSEKEIEKLIIQRNTARAAKDWATADRIRDQLIAKGIILEDGAAGTTWRRQQH